MELKVISYEEEKLLLSNPQNHNWGYICSMRSFSKEQILLFNDYINWYYFSLYQSLSEEDIIEYKDKLNWNLISQFQKLSLSFINKFIEKINFQYLKYNHLIDKETKDLFKMFY